MLKCFNIKNRLESQIVVNLAGVYVKGEVKYITHDSIGNLSFEQPGSVTGSYRAA